MNFSGDRCKPIGTTYSNGSTNGTAEYTLGRDEVATPELKSLEEKIWDTYTTVKANNTKCEIGWTPVKLTTVELCYFYNFTLASRAVAVESCRRMNATLPLPASWNDDRHILTLLPSTGRISKVKMGVHYGLWINTIFQEAIIQIKYVCYG